MMLLEFGFEDFDKVKRAFDPEVIVRAMGSTIPRVAAKARTEVSKQIRATYTINASTIKDTVSLNTRRSREDTVSVLSYRGGPLPIDRFSTSVRTIASGRGRRIAVSARVKKSGGRKVVGGGFPLRGRAGPTMQRKGEGRLPIERVFRLSVPQMINNDVRAAVERKIEIDANIELNRNLAFWQDRLSQ